MKTKKTKSGKPMHLDIKRVDGKHFVFIDDECIGIFWSEELAKVCALYELRMRGFK